MKYQLFIATISRRRRCCRNDGNFRSKNSEWRSCQSEGRSVCYQGFSEIPRCAHQLFVWIAAPRVFFFFCNIVVWLAHGSIVVFLINAEQQSGTTVPSFQSGSFAAARADTPCNQLGTMEGRRDVWFPVLSSGESPLPHTTCKNTGPEFGKHRETGWVCVRGDRHSVDVQLLQGLWRE